MAWSETPALPPGQRAIDHFPRFGATPLANRFPREPHQVRLQLGGDLVMPREIGADEFAALPRREQHSDFHCVTTWSRRGLRWGGVRLADFVARCTSLRMDEVDAELALVVLRAQDGYHAALPLADLLAADVLLADTLDGCSLPVEHGAPLRLVAPAHYGFKSVKHLKAIEFRRSAEGYRPFGPRFMSHPRARVVLEERGSGAPGWLLRRLYRPLIAPTMRRFADAMARHRG